MFIFCKLEVFCFSGVQVFSEFVTRPVLSRKDCDVNMKTAGSLALLLLTVHLSAIVPAEEHDTSNKGPDDVLEEYSDEEIDVAKQEEEPTNPCNEKECRRGEICIVHMSTRAKCICIPECTSPEPNDHRYEVCSKRNVTYHSECHLDRDHCLCRRRMEGCSQAGESQIQLDYYGNCQELTPCTEREFQEFPGRMREWLYIVLQQMARHAEMPNYAELLEKARAEPNHTHAVLWKFCDLDVDPQDRFVTRQELLHTIQSLKALEHCFVPFLDNCDQDSDEKITLLEWGRCLGIEDGKINDECSSIRKSGGQEN